MYTPHRPATPQAGLLYAFADLDSARAFLAKSSPTSPHVPIQVWEADADVVDGLTPMVWTCRHHELGATWRDYLDGRPPVGAQSAPVGTVLCREITLRERVCGLVCTM